MSDERPYNCANCRQPMREKQGMLDGYCCYGCKMEDCDAMGNRIRLTAAQARVAELEAINRAWLDRRDIVPKSLLDEVCSERDKLKAENARLVSAIRDALTDISQQRPEKPDHWSSCGQCANNIDRVQELLARLELPAPKGTP